MFGSLLPEIPDQYLTSPGASIVYRHPPKKKSIHTYIIPWKILDFWKSFPFFCQVCDEVVQTVTYEIKALTDGVGYVESELNLDILDSGYPRCSMYGPFTYIYHKFRNLGQMVGKYTMHGEHLGMEVHLEMQDARMPAQLPPRMSLFTCRYWEEHPERCPPCCPPPKQVMRTTVQNSTLEGGGFAPPQWSISLCKIWRASENKSKYRDPQQQPAVDSSPENGEPSWSPETLWRFIVKHSNFMRHTVTQCFGGVHGWSPQVGKISYVFCCSSLHQNRVEFSRLEKPHERQLRSESDPWDWYIYPHLGQLSGINIGKYRIVTNGSFGMWSNQLKISPTNQEAIENAWNLRELASNELPGKYVKMLGRRCEVLILIPIYGITW